MLVERGEDQGEAIIVLQAPSLHDLTQIWTNAEMEGLPVCSVRDAGKTEVDPHTLTVISIGPAPSRIIDTVTGSLPLA